MPDAPSSAAGSLSARAQEILRRANAQLAGARSHAPSAPPPPAPAAASPDPARPAVIRDLGELLDTVEAGIGAARAHLVTLSASLERIAHVLAVESAAQPAAPAARETDAARDAAWLLALEMAVAGDSRADADRRLREELGIGDPSAILDNAFGPRTPPPRRAYGA